MLRKCDFWNSWAKKITYFFLIEKKQLKNHKDTSSNLFVAKCIAIELFTLVIY